MTDVPALDPRWPRLLAAARSWRATLIPRTTTGIQGPTRVLLEAVEAFDEPCLHPRATWAFSFVDGAQHTTCGQCGATLA